ncbi:nucleoside hydrolase [Marispirochaeta aestuarii]|uniref:nucleoside hydrolase n=1 Tax=Marispirochaeta aestuarii TaxID=1963862 RepID=UPI0029C615DE|nr:nucleoside hydrolase [Marispirochaeta aestuarii]
MIYDKYSFKIPEGMGIRVITDTDAKNEADDQYCIVHTLLSPRFDNVGMIAAHFGDKRSKTSMEDSYQEVVKIFDLMKFEKSIIRKGATKCLPDMQTPVQSEGAKLIIEEAMKDDEKPLFVTFLGPLTDLASAYLIEPRIADRLTCIWIGGGVYPTGGPEYNLSNDINAANVVFNSTIPLWQVPRDVYHQMIVSITELEEKVAPYGEIGKYLYEQLIEAAHKAWAKKPPRTGEVWSLGDSPVVGLMLWDHMHDFDWIPAPNATEDMYYVHKLNNRPIRVYKRINSRFILEDFFSKIKKFAMQ